MAKSTRSKVKRSYRAKKREDSVYAAVEASRLERLSSKLRGVCETDKEGDVELADEDPRQLEDTDRTLAPEELPTGDHPSNLDRMDLDNSLRSNSTKKISTHGPRMSRRVEWRVSKGMPARPKSRSMNRQGGIAGKSRPGRPQRRR